VILSGTLAFEILDRVTGEVSHLRNVSLLHFSYCCAGTDFMCNEEEHFPEADIL
jgi:hypothetical protein